MKPRLLGHWGTVPGLNFLYAHLNRVTRQRDLNMMLVTGPGHGAPGIVANTYLEGSYTVFGQVESGLDVIDQLVPGDVVRKAVVLAEE